MNPTYLTTVAYSLYITSLFFSNFNNDNNNNLKLIITSIIPILISIYSVDCLYNGKCVKYSWINAYIITIWCLAISYIILFKKNYKI
jgi:hypothetical protein